MKKIIRLTESDLRRIVKRVINEENLNEFWADSWNGGSINGERGTYYTWASSHGYYNYTDKKWLYNKIESCSNVTDIYMLILHSKLENPWWGGFGGSLITGKVSTEAVAEAAFMALAKNPGWYNSVKNKLGEDPYAYCQSFMTTSKVYHKQSVDTSYGIIKKKKPN